MEEDEPECRVCRGPAEEDHPLYKPCKCSGSIGWTHQDCLQSWLAVQRNNSAGTGLAVTSNKCELCGHTFQFANQYAPDTPDRLPVAEVLLGVSRNFVATWLPLWLRVAVAAALWLVMAPLLTALIYHGWMHGTFLLFAQTPSQPLQSQQHWSWWLWNGWSQLKWHVLADELVSGAVLVAVILFSFLSLMSFVDFLRGEWHDPPPPPRGGAENNINNNNRMGQPAPQPPRPAADPNHPNPAGGVVINDEDVDEEIWRDYQQRMQQQQRQQQRDAGANEARAPADDDTDGGEEEDESDETEEDMPPLMLRPEEEEEEDEGPVEDRLPPIVMQQPPQAVQQPRDEGGVLDEDDAVLDADLNIALDELLGVRGPLRIVLRNLIWLLAFNTLYLALFAFVPRVIGSMAISIWTNTHHHHNLLLLPNNSETLASNATAVDNAVVDNVTAALKAVAAAEVVNASTGAATSPPPVRLTDFSVSSIFSAITQEGARLDTTFRLRDFAHIVVGYACAALTIVLMRWMWMAGRRKYGDNDNNNNNPNNDPALNEQVDQLRETLLEINGALGGEAVVNVEIRDAAAAAGLELNPQRLQQVADNLQQQQQQQQQLPPEQQQAFNNNNFDEDGHVAIGVAVDVILDAAVSIVKVGVLLFLKMFLLPVMLGFCLDWSTLVLFSRTAEETILYAGQDLFSFLFLHWVAGISFMLLVTVSVLQLREVAHPQVLAHIIRPQEPQPDLLGNLLHDPLVTHSKRLILSLVIYILLLILQVRLPVHLFMSALAAWTGRGADNATATTTTAFEVFQLKFCYVLTPRLQIPMELCIFHLCMLAFLEKNKNSIGEIQHYWLLFICRCMGGNLAHCMLPHEVEQFCLVGTQPIAPAAAAAGNETDDAAAAEDSAPEVAAATAQIDPFWYQLAEQPSARAREKMIDDKLGLRTRSPESVAATATRHRDGDTKAQGTRVIREHSDYIRLPPKSALSASSSSSTIMLPTKSGRYRLNRADADGWSDPHWNEGPWLMEVWMEMAGKPIPRPPEGWDDLGAGGADVQGRWAWDREKKSLIEEGVARRSLFFPEGQSTLRRGLVVAKLVLLVVLSWMAGTVASSILLASPLVMGRLLFHLLRLPDRYVHDPFCFALGSSVVFPLLRKLLVLYKKTTTSEQNMLGRLGQWLQSARLPPLRKLGILCHAGLYWFVLLPALIASAYNVLFLWPEERFLEPQEAPWSLPSVQSLLLSWVFGNMVLAEWSACCVAGVLTKEFWTGVFFNDPVANANNRNAEQPPRGDPMDWQGMNGRVARFWGIWKDVLLGWEWDQVDHVVLWQECTKPVVDLASFCLIVPGVVIPLLLHNGVDLQPYMQEPLLVTRMSTLLALVLYLALSCEEQVAKWFDVAHQTARDDRYLIGQLLMNHHEETTTTDE